MQPCKTFRLAFGLLHSALTTTLFQQPAERQAWISSLSLLVLLIRTDDPHDAAAADDLALVANSLHRCSNFHDDLRLKLNIKAMAAGPHPRRELTLMPRFGFPCPQLGMAAGAPLYDLLHYPTSTQLERGQVDAHSIADQQADEIAVQPICDVRGHLRSLVELHAIERAR